MEEFVPLRKKFRRAGTGEEDNFVPSYLPDQLADGSTRDNFEKTTELRWCHGIEVRGEGCPPPFQHFSELQLPPTSATLLRERGYLAPTAVQMQVIPCILGGRDVIVLAETGSGKTLAYTLPLCSLLSLFPPIQPGQGPRALIMAPTRELARQIHSYVQQFLERLTSSGAVGPSSSHTPLPPTAVGPSSSHTPLPSTAGKYSSLLVCGGIPFSNLAKRLKLGVDVVVATPGKLLKLHENRELCLDTVSYLVVDEADRFMQGSMEEDLRKVFLAATSSLHPRQTLLFSATLPENLERLARSAVLNPLTVEVGAVGVTTTNLEQNIVFMHSYQKPKQLLEVLRRTDFPPVLVFCNSISSVDEVVQLLRQEQFHVAGLHSEKPQAIRFQIIDSMKKGGVDVLVATDVASRGIDVPGITHVINYELPDSIEDYIHRCGRTARLRTRGKATSFLTLECRIASELRDLLASLDHPIPPELENTKQFGKKVLKTEFGDRTIN